MKTYEWYEYRIHILNQRVNQDNTNIINKLRRKQRKVVMNDRSN